MKYFFQIAILLFIQTNCLAETKNDTQNEGAEKAAKIMNLINKEIQTIKGNKYSGPELKHRLFELYSEKIKIIKEKETQNLLKSSPETVAKNGKDSFFKSSREQYLTAQKYALSLIKDYPNYDKISEIYYALAINSRDYGISAETEEFLKLSIKSNKDSKSKTMYNAKTSLAEYYYNNKKYHDAISYYTDVLQNKDNEWYGKHLYNASWCYLKERQFKKALELIKESFETTKNKRYVSMKEQINNAIGIFFVQADATGEGIVFFQNNTTPASTWLLMLAQSSMNKNNFSLTQEVLKAALKDTLNRKDTNSEMKVYLTQLDLYRESKKDDYYFEAANDILALAKKVKLDKEDEFQAINKIKEVAGFMQINLIKDKLAEDIKYSHEDYKKIMKYFDILSYLDRPNKNQFRYYQGETALSIHDFPSALKYYVRAILNSKISKDSGDTTRKSLEALLSTIDLTKLKKDKEDEYTIFTFKNFVLFYPKSEKSEAIYQKLFSKYLELGKTKKAVNVHLVYAHHYPKSEKIHREMLTQILDIYIKEKNTDKLSFWINKIDHGYLNFSTDYIQNSIAILGDLLFDKYQSLEKIGKLKEAMLGYESIYDSKQYPRRIKAEAAYAIATLNQEQNKVKESYKWLERSLKIYEDKDLIKITPSLLVLAKGYRLLQDFNLSTDLSALITKRFCNNEFKEKNDFVEILFQNSFIENKSISALLQNEESIKDCKIDLHVLSKLQIDNLNRLILNDNFRDILSYFQIHNENEKLTRQFSRYLKYKFWQYQPAQRESFKKELANIQEKYPQIGLDKLTNHYDQVKELKIKIDSQTFTFTKMNKFDEEKYNSEIEQYFSIITELNKEAIALSKESSPEEIMLIRNSLSLPYYRLIDSINSFIPQGVDNKYLEGFSKGMRQITESLLAKALQFDKEKTAFLEKNNFFIEEQKYDKFESTKGLNENFNHHSALIFSNTIDLGRGI